MVLALIMAMLAGSYLLLQNSNVQTYIIKKITEQLSQKTNAKVSIDKVDIVFFDKITLNNVLFANPENDTILFTNLVTATIDSFNIRERRIAFGDLSFLENKISIARNDSNQYNFSFFFDHFKTQKKDTTTSWKISCNQFGFKNSDINFSSLQQGNEQHFFIHELNTNVSDFFNSGDTTLFKINELNLNYNNQISINECSGDFSVIGDSVSVKSLILKTNKSEINNLDMSLRPGTNETALNKNMIFDIQLESSTINISELGKLIPSIEEIDETVNITGRIYGNIGDIKGKDLILKAGERTSASFDFYVNGIEDIETMYLFLDLKNLETTMKDISGFKIKSKGKALNLQFPEPLYSAGLLSYKGNFSGFLSDFVTFGTLKSRMGIIKTDVSVIPKKDGIYSYRGKITTTDFNLGTLLNTDNLGKITFSGNVDGDYKFSNKTLSGLFKGEIASLEARQYIYENIKLDGYYKDKMFDGMLNMNDSNLQFTFLGRWDVSNETPNFDFVLDVEKFVPAKLNIGRDFYGGELNFNMKAKFTGNKIDNLKGVIIVDEGYYKNKNGRIGLDGIQLISVPQKTGMELSFNSSYFDIKVNGDYQFQDLLNSVKSSMNKFIPALSFKVNPNFKPNLFDYRIIFKNLDDLTALFVPELKVETPFFLYGKMDSKNSDLELEGSIPGFQYKNFWFRNIFISNKVVDTRYVSKIKFSEILHKKGISIYNLAVNSEIGKNILHNKIEWYARRDSSGYSSVKSFTYFSESQNSVFPKIKTDFLPSEIFLTDTTWQLNPFTTFVDSSFVNISKFMLSNQNQKITIDGNISKDSTELLFVHLKNIDLEYFQNRISDKSNLKGIANSSFIISQLYNQPVIIADAKINNLVYKNQLIGDAMLTSNWDLITSEINSELEIKNKQKQTLLASGSFNPKTKELDYNLKADSLPLKLLETVISGVLSDFTGTTSGTIKVSGTTNKIKMDGVAKVDKGSLMIDYIQTRYFIDDFVYFNSDTILFKDVTFTDTGKNKGKLNGILVHDNFANILYDLTLISPKIRVLNTTMSYNELFYGDAFANCKVKILGRGLKVNVSGSMTTLPGTAVNISMEYENAIEQYDFLQFVNTEEDVVQDMFFYDPPKTDFSIELNIEVTPDAKTQLVYNSQIGDVIKAEGEGILLFEMDKYGDITLSGDYTVVKGDYLFTLQSIVNKRFTIAPGGTFVWSGDPYNAIINLSAIYSLKTSLEDLWAESNSSANYLYQRIPVECIIKLTDELINPTINFEINFPDENEDVKTRLQQFINTEEEINKQILSLIVLGKFYTPEYMRGQYQTQNPNMIGTTASELFSNQLSNWLSQISKNVDVGFKYRPGNSITNDELELALSTQIFNDRVILNGNIGNNVNPESNNSSQIVGDFDMRVKLTPNGKIQLKAYNHSNNDLIYETAPYTQGVGFSFKEEYNSFGELIHKIGSIFKKKEK